MSEDEIEPIEEIESKLDKVKGVVKRNWKPFAIGVGSTVTVIVIAGVTTYVTRGRRTVIVPGEVIANNMNSLFGPFFSKQNFTVVHRNMYGRGHPGYLTYWVEGQQVFESQKAASLFTGVPENEISAVIRGRMPTARNGQTFARIMP
jgi:hypothetical protein